jgi:hypothetical protein
LVMQDKREWEGLTGGPGFNHKERFINHTTLKDNHSVFKVTILKDAHQQPTYHMDAAHEIGCHAWIVYYHPGVVSHVAPYVRPRHLIRTYHTIDADKVPAFTQEGRDGCLLSGAVSSVYPLRQRLFSNHHAVYKTTLLRHPGYHRNGCVTNEYLKTLSKYKVAICTTSIYGYALRKIIEATACGCRVVTDLPIDDVLPHIDSNLIRIRPDASLRVINDMIREACMLYDPDRQQHMAEATKLHYDYRQEGTRLAQSIEHLRTTYKSQP